MCSSWLPLLNMLTTCVLSFLPHPFAVLHQRLSYDTSGHIAEVHLRRVPEEHMIDVHVLFPGDRQVNAARLRDVGKGGWRCALESVSVRKRCLGGLGKGSDQSAMQP